MPKNIAILSFIQDGGQLVQGSHQILDRFVQKHAKAKNGWLSLVCSSFLSPHMTIIWMWLLPQCQNN